MSPVQEILWFLKEAKRRLSPGDLAELRAKVPRVLESEEGADENGPYARSLAASGTGHTDFPDVSSNKQKHLGDVYAPKPSDK